MPSDELRDASTKLEWAQKDIDDVNAAIIAFATANPYRIVKEVDPQTGEEATIARGYGPIATGIARAVTHAVESIWSPLDYLASALAKRQSVTDRVYFPTDETRHEFITAKKQRDRERRFGKVAAALFNRIEPYGGGKGAFLHALRNLNNPNKHHGLMAIGTAMSGMHIRSIKVTSAGPFRVPTPDPNQSLEDGITLFIGVPEQEIEHNIGVAVNVAFRDIGIFKNEPVVPVLVQLRDGVKRVLETFDAAIFLGP